MRNAIKYLISRYGGSVAKREEIEKTLKRFRVRIDSTINFMISYGYLIRILRGLFYVKNIEEFKLKKRIDTYKLISLGMNKLKIKWYFGLYTALRLNGLTHEFFDAIFVINDSIFRAKEIKVNGERVKFIKLKPNLFGFGVRRDSEKIFSDPEKTILDFIYIFRYRSVHREKIISFVEEYKEKLNKRKIKEYVKFYPKSVQEMVKNARLI